MKKNIILSLIIATAPRLLAQPLQGDIYFERNNFPAAYQAYDSLFQTGSYTPRMLLRMAHIKRQEPFLGLYWLNVYLFETGDKRVLKQIQKLTAKYDVQGHTYSDRDFFSNLYHRFKVYLIILLGGCLILLLILRRKRIRSFRLIVVSLGLIGSIVGLSNAEFKTQYALTNQAEVKIYKAPSPAALNIGKLKKGSRVTVRGESDIWYVVEWREEEAFIHKQELKLLP